MPWSTPAATDSRVHHSARPSACATSASARRSRAWQQPGWSRVAGIVGCAFRSPIQTRIGTGTGIRPPCLPERTSVTGRRSRTRAGSAGKRPATHTGSLLPVSKRRRHPGGEVNAGGFGGQSPTTRARSAHDIKPRRSPQCSAGRYNRLQRPPGGCIVPDFKSSIADYVGLPPVIRMLQLVEQTQCCRRGLVVTLDDGLWGLERQVQDEKNSPSCFRRVHFLLAHDSRDCKGGPITCLVEKLFV